MSRHLVEPATDMIIAHIQQYIGAALLEISSARNAIFNYGVAIPNPREYFIDKNQMALQPTSIFVVANSIDFKKDRGANFVDASAKYGIAAICEAQTTNDVARITWRYQAALSQILDNKQLNSSDNTFSLKIIVQGAEFSETYDPGTQQGSPAKNWRKGVQLTCDVELWENL